MAIKNFDKAIDKAIDGYIASKLSDDDYKELQVLASLCRADLYSGPMKSAYGRYS